MGAELPCQSAKPGFKRRHRSRYNRGMGVPMTDKPDGKRWGIAMWRGALIGLLSGLLTGPTMLLWLLLYSFIMPNRALGSTAILGPIVGGVMSTIFGVVLGTVAAAVGGLLGLRLTGLRKCVLFAAILMTVIGAFEAFLDYSNSPERFAEWAAMATGMDVACPILAGIGAGALIGKWSEGRN
jgi:hypothetical protein